MVANASSSPRQKVLVNFIVIPLDDRTRRVPSGADGVVARRASMRASGRVTPPELHGASQLYAARPALHDFRPACDRTRSMP
jgi:hypothetical protein